MEQGTEAAVSLVAIIGSVCIGAVFWMIVGGALAYFFKTCVAVVPSQHHKLDLGKIWFIAIPYFGAIWNFSVIPKVSETFRSYFSEQGDTSEGDCGQQLATILCALVAFNVAIGIVGYIPIIGLISMVGCLTGPASLILLIVVIVKFLGLKNKVAASIV